MLSVNTSNLAIGLNMISVLDLYYDRHGFENWMVVY